MMSVTDKMIHAKKRALFIKRTLGTRVASGYLRNRGYSVEFAVWVLASN